MKRRIYLDWNATAPTLPEVRAAMIRAIEADHGNPSSVHREGQTARSVIERTRRAVARAVHAPPQAVVLTSGATESNNQVLRTHARYHRADHGDGTGARLACATIEHPSVLEVVGALGAEGVPTHAIEVDARGVIRDDSLEAALDAGATMVSVMWANNETGVIHDPAPLAAKAHARGALLHVDATQAFGRIPIDFTASGADLMTLSFHKMGGPRGIGAIVAREGLVVEAMMAGGHQERGRRPGTENVVAAAGLEVAAKLVQKQLPAWQEALDHKRALLLDALSALAPEVRGAPGRTLSNTLNLAFGLLDGEDLLLALDLEGIGASSGSACTAGSLEPSHVLLAMGHDGESARRSVRLSFGPTTTDEDLLEAAARIRAVVQRLRQL